MFLQKIQQVIKRWRINWLQRRLEEHAKSLLGQMYAFAEEITMSRLENNNYQMTTAFRAINLGILALERRLPLCGKEFRKEALAKVQLVIAIACTR